MSRNHVPPLPALLHLAKQREKKEEIYTPLFMPTFRCEIGPMLIYIDPQTHYTGNKENKDKQKKKKDRIGIIGIIVAIIGIIAPYVQGYITAREQEKSQAQQIAFLQQQNKSLQKQDVLQTLTFVQQQILPKCDPDLERNRIGSILTNASVLASLNNNLTGANHLLDSVSQSLKHCISRPPIAYPAFPLASIPGALLLVASVAWLAWNRISERPSSFFPVRPGK
jgi:hypothetical protein